MNCPASRTCADSLCTCSRPRAVPFRGRITTNDLDGTRPVNGAAHYGNSGFRLFDFSTFRLLIELCPALAAEPGWSAFDFPAARSAAYSSASSATTENRSLRCLVWKHHGTHSTKHGREHVRHQVDRPENKGQTPDEKNQPQNG
jgi:hypothetical protein